MGRIMALDIGAARIGVALSDLTKQMAQPFEVVQKNPNKNSIDRIKNIIEANEVELLIVGLPLNEDGSEGDQSKFTRNYCKKILREVEIPLEFHDERYSTQIAEDILIERGVRRDKIKLEIDKTAAAVILQDYLDGVFRRASS